MGITAGWAGIDLAIGYNEADTSPAPGLFLSRSDALTLRVASKARWRLDPWPKLGDPSASAHLSSDPAYVRRPAS
jgi:hypothetical protein